MPADITDLSLFPDGQFDAVICYGGALSYVSERRHRAASELVRVVRPGGILLISVMSRYGAIVDLVRRPAMYALRDPEGVHVWRVAEDGDLPGFASTRVDMQHPPMHMFTSDELRSLLPGCRVLEMAGSNVTTFEGSTTIDEVLGDQQAWTTAVELERELNSRAWAHRHRQPHHHGRPTVRGAVGGSLPGRGFRITPGILRIIVLSNPAKCRGVNATGWRPWQDSNLRPAA